MTKKEIEYFVNGYTNGIIPDYQVSALLMAIYFQKMNFEETLHLTLAMAESGDRLDLSAIQGIKADKHSTGGVGDKTTLVVGPMVAALGVKVAKMSGRGLGHTGGTIDKLESLPGFSTALSEDTFIRNVNEIGIAITGQTGNLAPADKKIYALRDVTDTVDSIPLIASSIMSKKIASGADAIVLDVKVGSGAFMKKEDDARELAKEMVRIGNGAGRKTSAILSNMDQPLGFAVGNALEVLEALETLQGHGPQDLTELSVELGAHMLLSANITSEYEKAKEMLKQTLQNGAAYRKFVEFATRQGADAQMIRNPQTLVHVSIQKKVFASCEGYVSHIDSGEVGICAMLLGGGRETKDSVLDLSVGIVLRKKVGDFVRADEPIAILYANNKEKCDAAYQRLVAAYTFSDVPVEHQPLIKGVIHSKLL